MINIGQNFTDKDYNNKTIISNKPYSYYYTNFKLENIDVNNMNYNEKIFKKVNKRYLRRLIKNILTATDKLDIINLNNDITELFKQFWSINNIKKILNFEYSKELITSIIDNIYTLDELKKHNYIFESNEELYQKLNNIIYNNNLLTKLNLKNDKVILMDYLIQFAREFENYKNKMIDFDILSIRKFNSKFLFNRKEYDVNYFYKILKLSLTSQVDTIETSLLMNFIGYDNTIKRLNNFLEFVENIEAKIIENKSKIYIN